MGDDLARARDEAVAAELDDRRPSRCRCLQAGHVASVSPLTVRMDGTEVPVDARPDGALLTTGDAVVVGQVGSQLAVLAVVELVTGGPR